MKFRASRQLSLGEIVRLGDVQFYPMAFHYRDQTVMSVKDKYLGFAIGRVEECNVGFFDLFGVGFDSAGETTCVHVAFFGRLYEVIF